MSTGGGASSSLCLAVRRRGLRAQHAGKVHRI